MDTLFSNSNEIMMQNLDGSYNDSYETDEHIVCVTYNQIGNIIKKDFYNKNHIYKLTEMYSYENVFSDANIEEEYEEELQHNDIPLPDNLLSNHSKPIIPIIPNLTTTSEKIQNASEQFIITYGDCVSIYPVSISAEVYAQFLDKNPFRYRKRYENSHYIKLESRPTPGSVYISHGPQKIACIFGQYYKGKSFAHNKYDPFHTQIIVEDSYEDRLKYFSNGLKKIGKLQPQSIAIPYHIGCSVYGGQWKDYEKIIEKFAKKNRNIEIKMYNYKQKKYSKDT
jgi:hypothetical protein